MVTATAELWVKALSLGARIGVPSTTALPFQWNQIGTTRGLPSVHV